MCVHYCHSHLRSGLNGIVVPEQAEALVCSHRNIRGKLDSAKAPLPAKSPFYALFLEYYLSLFIAVAWSGFLTYRSVAGSGEENGGVDHGEAMAPLIREDIEIDHYRRKGLPNLYAKEQDAEDTEEIVSVTMYPEKNCKGEPLGIFEDRDPGDEVDVCSSTTYRRSIRSFRIKGKNAFIEIFSDCGGTNYAASAFEADGCINVYSHPNFRHFKVRRNYFLQKKQIPERFLEAQRILVGVPSKSYRIIYSAESSEYFGYQMWANLYGYINSGRKVAVTRLPTNRP